ncbi:GH25 family lysozyme [Lactobacillus kitasatonis]|uniref:GH25 family lysozyme n=1 Tax=Lactobacillus kitasatonis TaxID=237446 RepID=UPI0026EE7359|nr:GH25 family lysozyme [Lactobacillus kitasatonis]
MTSRQLGVDVAVYQGTSMTVYHNAGAKFGIAKLTEGTSYVNPKAHYQIKSLHANHMYVHAYHFATFGYNTSRAKAEAKFFVNRAKAENISKKRYLWLDWETGSGNCVTGGKVASTKAILAFMKVCHDEGYKVGLYSGASLLRNNIDTKQIVKKFGTCIWVASYPTDYAIEPDFNYFPSMDGVAIWQFCDNWKGLNVDGNISLIDLHKETTVVHKTAKPIEKPKAKPEKKTGVVYAPIINRNPKWMIQLMDVDGHYTGKYIKTNTRWKYFDVKTIRGMKCYKLGTDTQWVPAKFTKIIE